MVPKRRDRYRGLPVPVHPAMRSGPTLMRHEAGHVLGPDHTSGLGHDGTGRPYAGPCATPAPASAHSGRTPLTPLSASAGISR